MRQFGWFGGLGSGRYLVGSKPLMRASICIVTLNAKRHLQACISALPAALGNKSYESIIVDNFSRDGSQDFIRSNFPNIQLIENNRNEGYTRAINQTLKRAKGGYLVVLNPDTIPKPDSISILIQFLEKNEKIGICGPKVVNLDGTFQQSCRRGIARPADVFSYFLGLAKKYPTNKRYTGYHLNHLDENVINEVSGVSGSCMVIKRKTFEEIGFFDEQFFAYQEDSDYCLRAKKMGWKVYYNPDSIVTHIGGAGGSGSIPIRSIFEWHRSYYHYYYKHFANDYSAVFNIFYSMAMFGKLIFAEGKYLILK